MFNAKVSICYGNFSCRQNHRTTVGEQNKTKKIDVPMLPEVANRVMRLTQDPNAITTDLAKLVQSDQVLAGHVMRIANSALYSPILNWSRCSRLFLAWG